MAPSPFGPNQQLAESPGQGMIHRLEEVGPTDDLGHAAGTERGQVPTHLFGQQAEKCHDVIGGAGELGA